MMGTTTLRRTTLVFAVTAAVHLAVANPTATAVILYEGFSDYTPGDLVGQAVGASTIGLDKTTLWESNNDVGWHAAPTGLTIGSGATTLLTSPGAVVKQSGSTVLGARLDLDNYVGTLYASYLYNMDLSSATGVPHQAVFTVIGDGTANTPDRRFRQLARNTTTGNSPVGVNYLGGATAGTGEVNTSQETFLILSRFTRVGETVNPDTPGVATLWALDSDQFDHFKSTGFTDIDAATVGSASTQVTGLATHTYAPADGNLVTLNSDWHLQLASAMARSIFITYDEVRMGGSFDAVTPVVPEPGTLVLLIVASLGSAVVRPRRATAGVVNFF